ncbi:PREDICTED: aspartyl protease family protein 2 [Ipomoea nil]|uniref:aspartyl protease family protein 2 n=1 Tax=Ipomoea nil TaxID=35883 RepID=UPI000900AC7D|nr:PREDICTED: aspartyl protease family protein 2 [Ipomoea nil]
MGAQLLSLLLSLLSLASAAAAVAGGESTFQYLKLPLLHNRPFPPTPSQLLSSDSTRLISLHSRRAQLPVTSGSSSGTGQYFVEFHLGTPPQRLLLVADTGSDLVWVTCSACRNCSSRVPHSAFLARHSASFAPVHCYDEKCKLVPHPRRVPCNRTRLHSPCRYEYFYSDGSVTSGFFAAETTAFNASSGLPVRFKNVKFGCGFRASGPSITGPSFNGAQGVLGLGRGPISLATQLGRRFGNKFSYCLMDYTLAPTPRSYLVIGDSQSAGATNGSGLSFTPLIHNSFSPTFYYIGIESVAIEDTKLPISPSVWAIDELGNGGTVMDSGTTLTFLAQPAYTRIVNEFKRRVKLPQPAELTPGFDLCINVSGNPNPILPKMSFRFTGGSVFAPPTGNYFLDTAPDIKCLALQPVVSPAAFSVIGNLMQQGFTFQFDRDQSLLGFSRHGCSQP